MRVYPVERDRFNLCGARVREARLQLNMGLLTKSP